MTKQELNRDIKRLWKKCENTSLLDETHCKEVGKEFTRLYHADDTLEYMTKQSILIMIKINLKYRFIALHRFGSGIKF